MLDQLADKGHLTCKEYGKAKIYLYNQDNFKETSTEQLNELDAQIKVEKDNLDAQKALEKTLKSKLHSVTSSMTNK